VNLVPTLIEQYRDGTEGADDSGKVTVETQEFGRNRQQPQIAAARNQRRNRR
jgi:hypothetical protein